MEMESLKRPPANSFFCGGGGLVKQLGVVPTIMCTAQIVVERERVMPLDSGSVCVREPSFNSATEAPFLFLTLLTLVPLSFRPRRHVGMVPFCLFLDFSTWLDTRAGTPSLPIKGRQKFDNGFKLVLETMALCNQSPFSPLIA